MTKCKCVILLLPSSDNKLLSQWQGPYTVTRKMGHVTYEVEMPERGKKKHQIFHSNFMKQWVERPEFMEDSLLIQAVEKEVGYEELYLPTSQEKAESDLGHLLPECQLQLQQVLPQALLTEHLGRTHLVEHHVVLKEGQPVCQPVSCVPQRLLPALKEELDFMQQMGAIEP